MNRQFILSCFLVLALDAPTLLAEEREKGGSGIADHPSKLVFPDIDFTPPDAKSHRHVLPCRVVVYVVEDHELPLVDVQVLVRTGTYLDPPGKYGLASTVSRLLRAGGTAKSAPADFDEELAFLAAEVRTGLEDTEGSASFNCLTKDLDRVLEMFFDMLKTPRFDAERLALQKSQDLQEMARRNDQTASIEGREWERLLRGPDFFTVERETKQSVESVSRDDLIAFHHRYYHPRNFLLAVSGDVATEKILAKLDERLKDWPTGQPEPEVAPKPPRPSHEIVPGVYTVEKADVNQGRVSMGHLSAMRDTQDYHALFIMNHILGSGGFTSRIMSRVRSDEGLAYSAGSRFEFGVYFDGFFKAFFQSKSQSVAQAVSMVKQEIERIRTTDVTKDEVDTAVSYAVGTFPRFFANASMVATTFASDEFTGRDPDFWRTYREKMKMVTTADVRRVADKYLHPDRLVILIVGNIADILKGKGGPEAGAEILKNIAGSRDIQSIPLPDPMTLEYPKGSN